MVVRKGSGEEVTLHQPECGRILAMQRPEGEKFWPEGTVKDLTMETGGVTGKVKGAVEPVLQVRRLKTEDLSFSLQAQSNCPFLPEGPPQACPVLCLGKPSSMKRIVIMKINQGCHIN